MQEWSDPLNVTQLSYAWARNYSPGLRRFISKDPMGSAGSGSNLYAYVGDDPINSTDPTGLFGSNIGAAVIGLSDIGAGWSNAADFFSFAALYATQDDPSPTGPSIRSVEPSTPSAGGEASLNQPPNSSACVVSPASLDAYLRSKNSPMAGQGANLMNYGRRYNLDPRLFVSLSGAETTFGTHITRGSHNAFNTIWNRHNPHDSSYPSWDRAINAAGHSLATNRTVPYDLSNTTTMYQTYCNGSACNAGLANVNRFMQEQGANPNALHSPCR